MKKEKYDKGTYDKGTYDKENKISIDYFNSMYKDCINFLKDETQCDFIKIKINELNPNPKNFDNINNIIYAVAK